MTLPVSVILPVKNGARFVRDAIDSVLAENVAEFLVVDDGSTDGTAALAVQYLNAHAGDTNWWVMRGPVAGVGSARNYGLRRSTQPWIALIDADDIWLPGKTKKQLAALEQAEKDYGDMDAFASSRVEHFLDIGYDIPATLRADKLGEIDLFFPSNLLCRRLVFHRVGGFDPDLVCANDVDWYHRAQKLGVRRVHVPEVLVRKRVHDTNLSLCQGHDMQRQIFEVLKRKVEPNMFPVFT
jgi:glycosyltransferase involved in cell wall biosynthesis